MASGHVWNFSAITWIPCELFINQSEHKSLSEANSEAEQERSYCDKTIKNWIDCCKLSCMDVDFNDPEGPQMQDSRELQI